MFFFFFNDTATTEIYTLSLHDALPISSGRPRDQSRERAGNREESRCLGLRGGRGLRRCRVGRGPDRPALSGARERSEEHTSELQSRLHLVCRLLLEEKKKRQDSDEKQS